MAKLLILFAMKAYICLEVFMGLLHQIKDFQITHSFFQLDLKKKVKRKNKESGEF